LISRCLFIVFVLIAFIFLLWAKEKGYPISTLLDNLFENHFFPSLRSGRVVSIPSGIT